MRNAIIVLLGVVMITAVILVVGLNAGRPFTAAFMVGCILAAFHLLFDRSARRHRGREHG